MRVHRLPIFRTVGAALGACLLAALAAAPAQAAGTVDVNFVAPERYSDAGRDPTDGATHYTRSVETTRWTRSLAKTVTVPSLLIR